ncbi:sugar transporter [Fusarium phyllophilum]|uniref:Sugar transporter n=1 Tax=Fusarium phyllophilum TaxID=47803 RepID=A0A8H5NJ64_9HYPO|nr:sugar transporter [Fusarium phyllophilum]
MQLMFQKNGVIATPGGRKTSPAPSGLRVLPLIADNSDDYHSWIAEVAAGTPPQKMRLNLDIAKSTTWFISDKTYAECDGCSNGYYQLNKSKTSSPVLGHTALSYGDPTAYPPSNQTFDVDFHKDTAQIAGVSIPKQVFGLFNPYKDEFSGIGGLALGPNEGRCPSHYVHFSVINIPEVAPPHARGLLVGLHGVSILVGYSSSAWVGFGFYFVNADGAQWRPPLAIQCLPPLILASGVYFIPESPRWLIDNDQHERAEAVLQRIYRDPSDPENHAAKAEFAQIRAQVELERRLPSSWASRFTVPHYRKRALIGFTTLLAGQLTGTTVINNYGPSLYAALGHGASASLALSAGWLTEGLVCNAINAVLLDYVGRKWLMVTGLIGCAISLLGVSIMVAVYGGTTNKAGDSAGVFFLYLHLTFYATCMDASTYVYGSEIWPTHLRGKGFAISCAGLFVGSLTLLEAAPAAFETIGRRFYLIMMAFTIICAIIFALFFPETKGMTLEEISALFNDEVAIEASSDTKTLSITSEKEKVKA